MTDLSGVFRDENELMLSAPEMTWQLADVAPELFAELTRSEPLIAELYPRLAREVPAQRVWGFGDLGVFVRPDRHVRALYLDLARIDAAKTKGGSIAIKGGEALCSNFGQMIK